MKLDMPYSKEELRSFLPSVGDRLVHTPHLHKSLGIESPTPKSCVVVYVNRDHLWYEVEFEDGFRESYKVPLLDEVRRGRWK